MSLKMTKKILGIAALVIIAVLLTGCVQLDEIKYIQRYKNDSDANIKDYGFGNEGEIVINQQINVVTKLTAIQDLPPNKYYLFLAVAVPEEFEAIDKDQTFNIPGNICKIIKYDVPNPTGSLMPKPQGYKWVTYAITKTSEDVPSKQIGYLKDQKITANFIFNVGNKAQDVNIKGYIWQASSEAESPAELNWQIVPFVEGINNILHIYSDPKSLSQRDDDKYVIIKNSSASSPYTLNKAKYSDLNLFYIAANNTVKIKNDTEELEVEAEKIIINGTLDANYKGDDGGAGGEGGIPTSINTVYPGKSGQIGKGQFAHQAAGSGGTAGKNATSSTVNTNGKGGKKGFNGLPAWASTISFADVINEITYAGSSGGGGGGGGGGGYGMINDDHAPPYYYGFDDITQGNNGVTSYNIYHWLGGKGGNGGKGGSGGGVIKLSAQNITIGNNGKIFAKGQPGLAPQKGEKGHSLLNDDKTIAFAGGAGGQIGNDGSDSQKYAGGGGGSGGYGGGGAGGSVLLSAADQVIVNGLIDVNGSYGTVNDGNAGYIIIQSKTNTNISSFSWTAKSLYEYTRPNASITSPATGTKHKGGDTILISWNCSYPKSILSQIKNVNSGAGIQQSWQEYNLAAQPFKVEYSVDGGEFKSVNGDDNWFGNATSAYWYTPTDLNSKNVIIKLSIQDENGKISEIISEPFTIDGKAPSIASVTFPTVSGTSDPIEKTNIIPVTWSNVSDDISTLQQHQIAVFPYTGHGSPIFTPVIDWQNTGKKSQNGSYNLDLSSLPSGYYEIKFKAADTIGNENIVSATRSGDTSYNKKKFLRDIDAPATVEATFEAVQTTIHPNFAVKVEDTFSNINYVKLSLGKFYGPNFVPSYEEALVTPESHEDKTYSSGSRFKIKTSIEKGTYAVRLVATDASGNSITKDFGSITIEPVVFSTEINEIEPNNTEYTSATPTFKCETVIPGGYNVVAYTFKVFSGQTVTPAKLVYSTNEAIANSKADDFDVTIPEANKLTTGTYTAQLIIFTDTVLNPDLPVVEFTSTTKTFNVDAAAPTIAAHPKTLPPALTSEANFILQANDPLSGLDEVKVTLTSGTITKTDPDSYNSEDEEKTDQQVSYIASWKSLADGNYTYKIEAVDDVGNAMAPQTGSFVFDKTEPIILAEGLLNTEETTIYVGNPEVNIKATIKEPHLGQLWVSYDSTKQDCTKDQGYDPNAGSHEINLNYTLAEGPHVVTIEAVDLLGLSEKITKTVIVDTINPVINSVEIANQDELLTNGSNTTATTTTPSIDINYTEANIASVKAEITTIDGQGVAVLEKETSNDDHVEFSSNALKDGNGNPILVNGGNYTISITAADHTGKTSNPFIVNLTITEGKTPHDLTIKKIKIVNNTDPDNIITYYDNNYTLDWSCSNLATGESFQVSKSTNPIDGFTPINDLDGSLIDSTAKISLLVNAGNPYVYLRVNVINADESVSMPSNTVLIKSIILTSTSVNHINYPVNDERKLNNLAEEIGYSNLTVDGPGGSYYSDNTNISIFDLISVTHVPTNKTYQMTYVDKWYKDSTAGMPKVLLNDELNIIVSKNINWIVVGNTEGN